MKKAIILALLLMAFSSLSHAVNNYYVSPSGGGTACTQAAPCGTINQALSTAVAGTAGTCSFGSPVWLSVPDGGACIHVLPGTYNAQVDDVRAGTSTAHIVIASETQYAAKVTNNNFQILHSYVDVDGFDISNPQARGYAVNMTGGTGNRFQYNYVHDNNLSGLCGGSSVNTRSAVSSLINGNIIRHIGGQSGATCTGNPTFSHGIYDETIGGKVTNNIISGVTGWGIKSDMASPTECAGRVITGNTVFNNNGGIDFTGASDTGQQCPYDNTTVSNNIVVNNGVAGTSEDGAFRFGLDYFHVLGKNNLVTNNLIYGNKPSDLAYHDSTCDGTASGTTPVTGFPITGTDTNGTVAAPGGGGCPANNSKTDSGGTAATFVNFIPDTNTAPIANYNPVTAPANYKLKTTTPASNAVGAGSVSCAAAGQNPCAVTSDFAQTAQTVPPSIGAFSASGGGGGGTSQLSIVPTSEAFGNVTVGTSVASSNFTITNTGTLQVTGIVTNITANPANFARSDACGTALAPLASCTGHITVTPQTAGAITGTYSVTSTAPAIAMPLTVTGVVPVVSLSVTNMPFGSVQLGNTSATQSSILTNTGLGTLSIASISLTGTDPTQFNQSNTCPIAPATLAPNGTCTISVTFKPTTLNAKSASISITDTATGSPQAITLSGTGAGTANPSMSPTQLTFSSQLVGTPSASQPVTLTNNGNAPLTISNIGASGDFSQTSNCLVPSNILAPLASCTINVSFTPTAPGNRSGTLTATTNAPSGTTTAALSGTGIQGAISLAPVSLTFPPQNVGTSSITQAYSAPTSVTPISYQATIPCPSNTDPGCPTGALTGTNWSYVDPSFPNSTFVRVTDVHTIAAANPKPQLTVDCGGSGETSPMSLLDDRFYVCSATQQATIWRLNWPTVTQLYTGQTGGCVTGGQNTCVNNLFFSRATNDIVYSNSLNTSGSLTIYKYDVSSTSTYTKTAIKDLSACVPSLTGLASNTYIDDVTVSNDDTEFGLVGSTGSGQTNPLTVWAIAWSPTLGCRVYNTGTGAVTGDYGPTGTNTGTTDRYSLHNVRMNVSGDWIRMTWGTCISGSCGTVATYNWQFATLNVTTTPLAPNGGGHQASGIADMVNVQPGTGQPKQAINIRPFASPGGAGTNIFSAPFPTSTNLTLYDIHPTWPLGEPHPVFGTTKVTYSGGFGALPPSTNAWDGEAVAWATDGSGIAWRLFHLFNSFKCSGCFSSFNVIGAPSTDGQYWLYTTDWNGMLGNGDGVTTACDPASTCRFDVFLVKLPPTGQVVTVSNTGTAPVNISSVTLGHAVTLSWTASPTSGVTYNLYKGTASGVCPGTPYVTGIAGTSFVDTLGLTPGNTYFYNVTAVSSGTESACNGQTQVTIPSTPVVDFGLINSCGSILPALASCTATIIFTPTTIGPLGASLIVADDAPGSPQQASIFGTGIAPTVTLLPSSVAFGSQITGSISSAQNLTLTNTGTGTLNIASIALTGANANQFTQSGTCGTTLAAGANCTIAIRFAPTVNGPLSASLTVTDNASGSPHSSTLTGTGTPGAPVASLTPSSLTFPATLIGIPSAGQTATLQNTGTANLTFSSIAITGDFSQTNTCISPIVAPTSCAITIKFTPTAAGNRTGTLSVIDNATGSPHIVALSGTGLQALASPSPASIAFGNAVVGFPTAPTTVTLSNGGTATLQSIVVSLAGTNPGDYILNNTLPNACGTTLAAGGSCQVTVAFSPTTTGARPATLRFADSAANTPQDVPLTGTGISPTPAVTLTPATLDLGSQQVGATSSPMNTVLKNTGTGILTITSVTPSGDFADTTTPATNCGGSLAVNATCNIAVTFTPTTTGTRTGAITVTTDATSSPDAVTLTGVGTPIPVPVAILTPSSLTYGSQQTGTSSLSQDATLKNTGSANLTFTSITLTGANVGDYTISANGCVSPITPTSACVISIRFSPIAAGTRTASLSVVDNASGSPHTVALSGTAFVGSPGISFNPTSLNFGSQAVQVPSAASPVQITNPGTAALLISNITTTGDYSQTNGCGGSVAAGATCTVQVTFTPLSTGVRPGTLVVTDNASGSPHSIPLTGSGAGANAVISPSSLIFSSQIQGTPSSSQPVTLSNTGNITMTLNSISFGGGSSSDYLETDNCVPSLGAGASCTVNVTFRPTAVGARPATLVFNDSAPNSPQSIPITGTGLAPFGVVNVTPTTLNFGSAQSTTTTLPQTITVKNVGTALLHISGITKTGTNPTEYTLTSGCGATLAINATCTLSITFTPSTTGTRTANISIASDDPNSPTIVSMTGVGTPAPAPRVQLSASFLTFPLTQVGNTTPTQNVIVSNIGDATLTISGITLGTPNATDYVLTNPCGASIVAGANCTLQIAFRPIAGGTRTSSVSIADNASDTPQIINLTGNAFVGTPTADLSTSTITFTPAQVVLTTSGPQSILLTNNGNVALAVTSVTATSDLSPGSSEFVQTNNCGSAVPSHGSCTINATFTPQTTGSRTGRVTLVDNAASSPQVVILMGTGINPVPPPGNSATGIGGLAGSGGKMGQGVH